MPALSASGKLWLRSASNGREHEGIHPSDGIKTSQTETPIKNLSGGNQQKVIIARWLLKNCRILILDEPTRGIDVKAKFEIQSFLRELTKEGLSIIYISSEMEEVLEVLIEFW